MSAADQLADNFRGGINGLPPFRVLPRYTEDEAAFWHGGEQGELRVQRCTDCNQWNHPATPICPHCLSRTLAVEAVSGRGSVYSYTINFQPWNPTFAHPYVIAVIELEEQEGLRLVSNIYDCAASEVYIGMPVTVFFERWQDVWLPLFRPIGKLTNG